MTYVSDKIQNIAPEAENHKAADEGGDIGFHNANLFDLDEDLYGNKFDEATGKRIDNSTDNGLGVLAVRVVSRNGKSHDILGDLPKLKDDDLADKWLREHDPDWGK